MFVHIRVVRDTLIAKQTKVGICHFPLILVYELQNLLSPFPQGSLVQMVASVVDLPAMN